MVEGISTKKFSNTVTYKGNRFKVKAGKGEPVCVNLSIGLNKLTKSSLIFEQKKISRLLKQHFKADLMMDLSIVKASPEPWETLVLDFGGPVGIVPHYTIYKDKAGIDKSDLINRIRYTVQNGISFITIHASPTMDLFRLATEVRNTPIISRGGGIVIRDMLINNRKKSVYFEIFDTIVEIAAKSELVIHLGTSFRSSNISEGLDLVAKKELQIQKQLIERARVKGAQVVLEGPGHLMLSRIDEYMRITKDWNVPLMPLGPIVTDAFPGQDHIINAIGACYMMTLSKGGIINAVTRIEHQGGIPNASHLIEALRIAKIAAHAATLNYHKRSRLQDQKYSNSRENMKSCVVKLDMNSYFDTSKGEVICNRCGHICPLKEFC